MNNRQTVTNLQRNIDAISVSQEKLRLARGALSNGQFLPNTTENTPNSNDLTSQLNLDLKNRSDSFANSNNAVFRMFQNRIINDLQSTFQQLDAIKQFNTTTAQYMQDKSDIHSEQTESTKDIIDVEVKEVTQVKQD